MNRILTTTVTALVLSVIVLASSAFAQTTPNYQEQGGAKWVIGSTGELETQSGSTIDVQAGSVLTVAGTSTFSGATTISGALMSSGGFTVPAGQAGTFAGGSTLPLSGVQTVESGATLQVKSGGALHVSSGATATCTGTIAIGSGGVVSFGSGSKLVMLTTTAGTTATISAAVSGSTIVVTAEDITLTLPTAAAGLNYRFIATSTAGAQGLAIDIPSGPKMYGNGFTAASGKGAWLTHATARAGDVIEVICDGTDWYVTNVTGTWDREP